MSGHRPRRSELEPFSDGHADYLLGPPGLWHGQLQRQVYDAQARPLSVSGGIWAPSLEAAPAVVAAYRAGYARGHRAGEARLAARLVELSQQTEPLPAITDEEDRS